VHDLSASGSGPTKPPPQPIQRFARFFRGYNVGLSLVVAAVPVLIGVWNLVPLYQNVKNPLTLITSVASYLIVGFIFSQRVAIGKLYFMTGGANPISSEHELNTRRIFGLLPLICLLLFVISFSLYISSVNSSISAIVYDFTTIRGESKPPKPEGNPPSNVTVSNRTPICDSTGIAPGESALVAGEFSAFGKDAPVTIRCNRLTQQENGRFPYEYSIILANQDIVDAILSQAPSAYIPHSFGMQITFLLAFLFATSAFILMGLKEYIQELLKLRDEDMIAPRVAAA